ncbi:SRF-like protein [Basidiobolus meristosporus CBS 931.73]|uniref:SRF-like protein n=1 Tax=Basidiobolus meristosporus CBS 931.73 TaxID=1314790 RepID=A0A1Y1Y2P4_9FUNG|nr:SRF-like protein [Basidiobolus meristosporus CBS 931.73]|eukprot:ORX92273.1 SRF-like protein [Basidiobolus meristosporus CBS 931.73]
MGRKKIKIKTIENDRQKTVTFTRRRGGLIKKAHELAVLCDCKVVLLMFDSKDECHMYSSEENPEELMGKYYNKEFHSGDSKKRKFSKLDDE